MAKISYCFKNSNDEDKTIDLYSDFSSQYPSNVKTYEQADYWGSLNYYNGGEDSHFRTLPNNYMIYAIPHRTLNITKNSNIKSLTVTVTGLNVWTSSQTNIDVAANRQGYWSATAEDHYHFVGYTNDKKELNGTLSFVSINQNVAPEVTIDTYTLTIINNTGMTVSLSGVISATILNNNGAIFTFNYGTNIGTIYATSSNYTGQMTISNITSNMSYKLTASVDIRLSSLYSNHISIASTGSKTIYIDTINFPYTQSVLDSAIASYYDWVLDDEIGCEGTIVSSSTYPGYATVNIFRRFSSSAYIIMMYRYISGYVYKINFVAQ